MGQIEDNLGRQTQFEGEVEDFLKTLKSAILKTLSEVTKKQPNKNNPKESSEKDKINEEILNSLKDISGNFKEELDKSKEFHDEVKKHYEKTEKEKQKKKLDSSNKNLKEDGLISSLQNMISKKFKSITGGGFINNTKSISPPKQNEFTAKNSKAYARGDDSQKILVENNVALSSIGATLLAIKDVLGNQKNPNGSVKDSSGNSPNFNLDAKMANDMADATGKVNDNIKNANKGASGMGALLKIGAASAFTMAGEYKPLQHTFDNILGQEEEFRIGMKEIAFETQGITGNMPEMQKQWISVDKQVAQTGKSLADFEKIYENNMKKGAKSAKQEQAITKTGLNLATMIGSDAAATADIFSDWGRTLRMNNMELSEFSRGAQTVARDTGVTGDNLLEAIKSTKQIALDMRNAGDFSSEAATNVLALQAAAQKSGVGEQATEIQKALSSMANFQAASMPTKTLLSQAVARGGGNGQDIRNLQTGNFNGPANEKILAKGFDEIIKNVSLQVGGKDKQFTREDYDKGKVDKATAEKVDYVLKQIYGEQFGLGQLAKASDAITESTKSYSDKVKDLNAQLALGNISTEKRIQLEADKNKLQLSQGESFMTEFTNQSNANPGESMEKAMQDTLKQIGPEMQKNLGDIIQETTGHEASFGDPKKFLQEIATVTAQKLNDAGSEKDFSPDLEKAIKSGDNGALLDIMKDMNDEQQKIGVTDKNNTDPMLKALLAQNKFNEQIKMATGDSAEWLKKILGATGIVVGYLLTIAAQNYLTGGVLKDLWAGIKGFKQGFMGTAGETVSGATTKTVGEAETTAGEAAATETGAGLGAAETTAGGAAVAEATGGSAVAATEVVAGGAAATEVVGGLGATLLAFATGPVGLTILAITALVGILYGLYKLIVNIPAILKGIWHGIEWIFKTVWDVISGIGELIWGAIKIVGEVIWKLGDILLETLKAVFVTFPMWLGGLLIDGLKAVFITFPMWLGDLLIDGLKAVFITFPKWLGSLGMSILKGLEDVFVVFPEWLFTKIAEGLMELPKWLFSTIKNSLASLAGNELFGPIFKPFLDIWNDLSDAVGEAIKPLQKIFSVLSGIFTDLRSALDPILGPADATSKSLMSFSGIFKVLGTVLKDVLYVVGGLIKILSYLVGFILKVVLYPIELLIRAFGLVAKAFGLVAKAVAYVVEGIIDLWLPVIKDLMNVFSGVFEFLAGLFTLDFHKMWSGIKKTFGGVINFIIDTIMIIPRAIMKVWDAIEDFFGWIGKAWDGITSTISDGITYITNLWNGFWSFIGKGLNLIKSAWDSTWTTIKNGISFLTSPSKWLDAAKNLGVWLYDTAKDAFGKVWDWLKSLIPTNLYDKAIDKVAGVTETQGTHGGIVYAQDNPGDLTDVDKKVAAAGGEDALRAKTIKDAEKSQSGFTPIAPSKSIDNNTNFTPITPSKSIDNNTTFTPITPAISKSINNQDTTFVPIKSPSDSQQTVPSIETTSGQTADNLTNNGNAGSMSIPSMYRGTVTPVDQTAGEPVKANAMPMTDVYSKMANDRVANESKANQSRSPEMSSMADAADQSVVLLTLLHTDMREMIDTLKGGSSKGSTTVATRTNKNVPSTAPDYGRWQYSNVASGASRSVNTIGV